MSPLIFNLCRQSPDGCDCVNDVNLDFIGLCIGKRHIGLKLSRYI